MLRNLVHSHTANNVEFQHLCSDLGSFYTYFIVKSGAY